MTKKLKVLNLAENNEKNIQNKDQNKSNVVSQKHLRHFLDIENLKSKLREFSKERDWEKFHNPKNIATALSVEASELLEIFQWSNDGGLSEINDSEKRKEIEK